MGRVGLNWWVEVFFVTLWIETIMNYLWAFSANFSQKKKRKLSTMV